MSQSPYKRALQAIADGRLPCLQCGEAHAWKPNDPENFKKGGTWEGDDGHGYRKMDVGTYARLVLREDESPQA